MCESFVDYSRVAVQSEMMPDDSPKALELKERARQGKMNATDFDQKMRELQSSQRHRADPKKAAGSAAQGVGTSAEATAGPTQEEQLPSVGRGTLSLSRDASGDLGKDPGASTLGMRRHVSSGGLRKLGGRLVPTPISTRAEHGSGESAPALEGSRPSESLARRRSPRRSSLSPCLKPAADSGCAGGASGVGVRRSWNLSNSNSRNTRRASSSPPSPDRVAPTQPSEAVAGWVQGAGPSGSNQRQSTSSPLREPVTEEGRLAGGVPSQAPTDQSHTTPLTASEADNMSSVSNTSTVITDLSLRLDKIEDMLARLLEAKTERTTSTRDSDKLYGRPEQAAQVKGDRASITSGSSERQIRGNLSDVVNDGAYLMFQTDGRGAPPEGLTAVKCTTEELSEVRGQLQQLQAAEVAVGASRTADATAMATDITFSTSVMTGPVVSGDSTIRRASTAKSTAGSPDHVSAAKMEGHPHADVDHNKRSETDVRLVPVDQASVDALEGEVVRGSSAASIAEERYGQERELDEVDPGAKQLIVDCDRGEGSEEAKRELSEEGAVLLPHARGTRHKRLSTISESPS